MNAELRKEKKPRPVGNQPPVSLSMIHHSSLAAGRSHGQAFIIHHSHLSGQTMIFFIMVLVILVFIVLWNFDLHKILHVKATAQNAGDAAALMAARWQGITLNLIGDLNIMHALALSSGSYDAEASIVNMQARLCYVGPMIAFMAAQQAAKNNGVYSNDGFTELLREHVQMVRYDYPSITGPDGEMLFPEPYPGCWEEYADMLELIASDGVAAGPDSTRLFRDYSDGHYLLRIDFYEAIAGKSWCWFYHNAPTLLEDYENFFSCWWPPLPEIPSAENINSEIFGLGLSKITTTLSSFTDLDTISSVAAERGFEPALSPPAFSTTATWYCYAENTWAPWDAMSTSGEDPFPATGPVKPQYDYTGADAAIRIEALADRLTPGAEGSLARNAITWTAAAKPFGYLNEEDRPNSYCLVLPAFREVRLIPVDASSAPSGGWYNLAWHEHIEEHLTQYMIHGPGPSSCWYCQQLLTWENENFRQEGIDWLAVNSDKCIATGGDGIDGRRGGGRRRGH